MSLESAIYEQRDPFFHVHNEFDYTMALIGGCYNDFALQQANNPNHDWDSLPPHHATATSSSDAPPTAAPARKKRRRRTTTPKNQEEMENQRMTHITVERNRRRQMNEYLAVLRSLMPPSYAQRGDQASIVGGAINFVKELEQFQQSLEAHKGQQTNFSNFFTFPQHSTTADMAVEKRSDVADIEVSMVESHVNIKILSRKRPKQLVEMVAGFQSLSLAILHLNITTVDQSVLYSFSVKVAEDCQFTVNEIATAVHGVIEMIERELN